MEESFRSPQPSCASATAFVCPPTPRQRKPAASHDDSKHVTVPLFFPSSWSVLGSDDEPKVLDMNVDPDRIGNRPVADFSLRSRRVSNDDEVSPTSTTTRVISIEHFPTPPFAFPDLPPPTGEAVPTQSPSETTPTPTALPSVKLHPFTRRRSLCEHRRASFGARCA